MKIPSVCVLLTASCVLFLLPFTFYIWVFSSRPSLYTNLTEKSGLFLSESEIREAGRELYHGLLDTGKVIFSSGRVVLTEEERIHMQDVSALLRLNRYTCVISFFILIGLFWSVKVTKQWKVLLFLCIGWLVGMILFITVGSLFFDQLFYLFHRVLFRNYLWLLPAESPLLRLFPADFFFRHFIGLFSFITGFLLFVMISAYQLSQRSHHENS